jgi:hypothetical protein
MTLHNYSWHNAT